MNISKKALAGYAAVAASVLYTAFQIAASVAEILSN